MRITAPSIKEAQNLAEIKLQLRKKGYTNPLIADIHFTPNAALEAAKFVEKVRINPGNYADRKKFESLEQYTNPLLDWTRRALVAPDSDGRYVIGRIE